MPTISTRALALVADDLAIDLPYPIEAPRHAVTAADRARLRREVQEELRAQSLTDHTGQVIEDVHGWLNLLAAPEVSIDSAFLPDLGATPTRVVVARAGRSAVLATQPDDDHVELRPVPFDRLGDVVVDLLPPAARGTEMSLSLPTDHENGPAEDRQALARLAARPRLRGGQIAANSFSRIRGRRRSAVLSWFDDGTGRYLAQHRDGRDGRRWVTVAPADTPVLRMRITEMVAAVTS
ncbi:ESX secretion-associated protein EspG [Actinophytocola oryzae]|uniref:ESAT-6 protein secretion system EspG family protein n=1 Tax=Actinophytocola oryzae TaxID=502181 RepID=A0A4R7UVD5_9PSEU|nr:ESX secretion-associated protein EspG [Actinophytocola oryzae]TDV40703.1 ESAT-6 protein secretion system EspG family protein [Actinophytocola oryzae]